MNSHLEYQVPRNFLKEDKCHFRRIPGSPLPSGRYLSVWERTKNTMLIYKLFKNDSVWQGSLSTPRNVSSVKLLPLFINQHGISPDPLKTTAIKEMPPPKTVSELRRFMGMITSSLPMLQRPCRDYSVINKSGNGDLIKTTHTRNSKLQTHCTEVV